MRRARPIPEEGKQRLSELLKEVKSKGEFQRVQCVWLRAALGLTAAQIALALGWRRGSVKQVHSRYLRHGEAALRGPGRGGRRRAYLTVEEERRLLSRFVERAERGGMLVVSEIKAALEAEVGHRVDKTTVYRLLARHGWRKLTPRPRHPKSDPVRQEEFKKNSRD